MVAALYYTHKHHSHRPVSATDKVRDLPPHEVDEIDPHTPAEFQDGLRELARDLILREQQMELLISSLPGLEESEEDQVGRIRKAEEELRKVEEERRKAVEEKERLLEVLGEVIRSVKRP